MPPWGFRILLLYVFGALSFQLLRGNGYGADWAPLWTAGKLALSEPALVYDFELVTRLQTEPFREVVDRPYIYPPSALLLFTPLSLIPFWISFAAFSVSALLGLVWVCWRLGGDPLLVATAPPVILMAVAGQPTLLVLLLVLIACARLDRSGVLLGLAAVLKPTLLLLAPVALIAGGHWRALGVAAATAAIAVLASVIAFGAEPWFLWIESLPRFQQLIMERENFLRTAVTPYAFAARLGFESVLVIVGGALVALPAVWIVFSRRFDPPMRAAVMMGGALLVTPYAMFYELAVLAPALAALALARWRDLIVPTIWAACLFVNLSVVGLIFAFARLMVKAVGKEALPFVEPGSQPSLSSRAGTGSAARF